MQVNPQSADSYRFGPYLVDAPAGQLRKRGAKIRLAGQPFEILLMLLSRPGQVVTREEIQQRLWPQETFVDFENSLNKAINKLRQALSDSADEPLYIETLPRRGYRFVGSLHMSELAAPLRHAPQPRHEPGRRQTVSVAAPAAIAPARHTALWRIVSLSILLSVLGLLGISLRPLPAPRVLGSFSLTDSSRVDPYGGLHTDGVRLYFLLRRGAHWELAQMPTTGGEVQPISTPFSNARIFSVSPDGSHFVLGAFEVRHYPLPVWIMSSVGGVPKRLSDIVANDASFTRDGSRVTYSTDQGIFEIGVDGLTTRKLVDAPGAKWALVWSPDGSRLRFDWIDRVTGSSRIWEVAADGKNLHQILPNWSDADDLCCGRWSADGRYFFFLGYRPNEPVSIWAIREQSGWLHRKEPPMRLSAGPVRPSALLPSTNSGRLYFLGNETRMEYVRLDSKTHTVRGLLGGQGAAWATIAPSGDWAVYRGAADALWKANLDGNNRLQLVTKDWQAELPAIRPDGNLIAFRGQPPGVSASRIYVIPAEGGDPVEFASSRFPLETPAWSPDGKKLSYSVNAENDPSSGIYVADFTTKAAQKILGSERCWKQVWSPDSKYLACVSTPNDRVLLYDWAKEKWAVAAEGKVLSPVMWARDSSGFFFQDILEEGEPVRRFNVKNRSNQRVFDCAALLEGGVQRCGLESLAPDGSFVFRLTRGDHDVYAVDVVLP